MEYIENGLPGIRLSPSTIKRYWTKEMTVMKARMSCQPLSNHVKKKVCMYMCMCVYVYVCVCVCVCVMRKWIGNSPQQQQQKLRNDKVILGKKKKASLIRQNCDYGWGWFDCIVQHLLKYILAVSGWFVSIHKHYLMQGDRVIVCSL